MKTIVCILTFCHITLVSIAQNDQTLYKGEGKVYFISDAPLETIEAETDELNGLLDLSKKTFAFSINIRSFDGFNSPLQKEHFNEHYLESEKYPKSTFKGKVVGTFDCKDCTQELLAKGTLTIHNVTKVVVLPVKITNNSNGLSAESDFEIKLMDYDISIPKILEAKISPIIQLEVNVDFKSYGQN
jgi:polyisoprenoid-binding protein YceI